jgi:hypothetical protein
MTFTAQARLMNQAQAVVVVQGAQRGSGGRVNGFLADQVVDCPGRDGVSIM